MSPLPSIDVTPREEALVYTLDEAAHLLKVSKWTLNRLVQARDLGSIQIGTRRLIPADAISGFLANQQGGSEAPHVR